MLKSIRDCITCVANQPDSRLPAKDYLALCKWLFIGVLAAYLYQGIIPAFNQDDIVQLTMPEDGYSMLAQGRWGYYLVFVWLQDANGWPIFSTLVGCSLLVAAHMIAAHHLGFFRTATVSIFVLVASISVYYASAFDFDSTRIAYPLANFFAATGVYLLGRRRYATGVIFLAIAPALYPAATQFAGALWLCGIIHCLLTRPDNITWKKSLLELALLVGSLVAYMLLTKISASLFGYALNNRSSISISAPFDNFNTIKLLLYTHAFPMLSGLRENYHPIAMVWSSGLLTFGFFVYVAKKAWQMRGALYAAGLLLLSLALMFAPFGLIFASATDYYPTRSLYTYALLWGFFAATLIDDRPPHAGMRNVPLARPIAASVFAIFLIAANMAQISRISFDQYLQSKVDFLEASRIISSIDNVISGTPLAKAAQIPLVVIYDQYRPSAVRGHVSSGAQAQWSKEVIFRFLDPRFKPTGVLTDQQRAALAGRPDYPGQGSIFVSDGAVIVIRSTAP